MLEFDYMCEGDSNAVICLSSSSLVFFFLILDGCQIDLLEIANS